MAKNSVTYFMDGPFIFTRCFCFSFQADNFTVGLDLDITLEIKPRTLSGVLLSVHNQGRGAAGGDYLVLQMVNGEVRGIIVFSY